MTRQTCTSAEAADDYVTVNWCFFNPSCPHDRPLPIEIPRQLFERPADECCDLFVHQLRKEYNFLAKTITFHQPIEQLSLDEAYEEGWTNSITDVEISFKKIPPTSSFAKRLKDQIDDEELVHLVVTAEGHYLSSKNTPREPPMFHVYDEIVENRNGQPPSIGAKASVYARTQANPDQAIHDGRDPINAELETIAPPIEIFHPVFGEFQSRCRTVEVSREDLLKVHRLMQLASEIGETNTRDQLEEVLGVSLSQEVNTDNTFVYLIVLGKERIPILITQFGKEIGEGGCDPSIQCGLSMKQLWIQPERKSTREKCCCPTLLLAGGGPWLGVLGAVFTDKIIVQRLTDMMWIGHSSMYEDSRLYRLTQALVALREAVHSLKESYEDVHQYITPYKRDPYNPNKPHPRFFPYPTSFTENNTSTTIKFKYLKPLQKSPRCVAFLAQTDDNSLVVVKFVDRYGREVHEFLAQEGHAPKLHYCGPLPQPLQPVQPQPASTSPVPGLSFGPLQMVVMDYVEPLSEDLPATARPQVEEILKKMHKEGYVFGDLREPNIIFNKNKIQLIDFDWAGAYDMAFQDYIPDYIRKLIPADVLDTTKDQDTTSFAHYPRNLSKMVFAGAEDLQPIRPVHDWRMLNKLVFVD